MDEAAMDNLPVFDTAEFVPEAHTLDLAEPGLNALVVLEGQMLAQIAALLGRRDDATALAARADALASRVRERLWDPERAVFAARRWSGEWVRSLAPTSFYALTAGIATPEQAEALVRRHLLDLEQFWGPRPLPASAYDDPATADDVYWRGRIWPPLVFLTWEGLRRYGFEAEAEELAARAWRMFAQEWETRRHCHENFRIDPEADAEVADSDAFYTWGALLALMPVLLHADASPWSGLTLRASPDVDPVTTASGAWAMRPRGAGAVVERDGRAVLELSRPVTLRELEYGPRIAFAADVPDRGLEVVLRDVDTARIAAAETADGPLALDGGALRLEPGARRVAVHLRAG